MRRVFLDTVGLIAIWDETDQWHAAAEAAFNELAAFPLEFVTTTLVLFECGNAAARRSYRVEVFELWRRLERDGNLISPLPNEIKEAWELYDLGMPGSAGIVDLLSFAAMRRMGIKDAFTNDKHFTQAGFTVLL